MCISGGMVLFAANRWVRRYKVATVVVEATVATGCLQRRTRSHGAHCAVRLRRLDSPPGRWGVGAEGSNPPLVPGPDSPEELGIRGVHLDTAGVGGAHATEEPGGGRAGPPEAARINPLGSTSSI